MDQHSQDSFQDDIGDDAGTNRHEARDSLFLMAGLRLPGSSETTQVRVRNLSAGGLMADYAVDLDLGVCVEFDVRGIGWVPGKVVWSAVGRIGVAFDRQIDPRLARKPVGHGAQTPVYVKPILTRR